MIHMNFFDLCLTWLYFEMLFLTRALVLMFVGCNPQNVVDGRLGLQQFIGYKPYILYELRIFLFFALCL